MVRTLVGELAGAAALPITAGDQRVEHVFGLRQHILRHVGRARRKLVRIGLQIDRRTRRCKRNLRRRHRPVRIDRGGVGRARGRSACGERISRGCCDRDRRRQRLKRFGSGRLRSRNSNDGARGFFDPRRGGSGRRRADGFLDAGSFLRTGRASLDPRSRSIAARARSAASRRWGAVATSERLHVQKTGRQKTWRLRWAWPRQPRSAWRQASPRTASRPRGFPSCRARRCPWP